MDGGDALDQDGVRTDEDLRKISYRSILRSTVYLVLAVLVVVVDVHLRHLVRNERHLLE